MVEDGGTARGSEGRGAGWGRDPLGRDRRNPTGRGREGDHRAHVMRTQSSMGSSQHFPIALAPPTSQRNGLSIVVAVGRSVGWAWCGAGG